MAEEGSRRTVVVAVFANATIALFKFAAFFFTRSITMLAEAFHSVADSCNQALLLLGQARARRPETRRHPFGYSRERYFWAFVVSVLIFGVGSIGSFAEGIHKLSSDEPISSPGWAFGVLGVSMVLDGYALSVAVRQARREHSGSLLQYIQETKTPEVAVVLLEDAAAVGGMGLALVAVTLSVVAHAPAFDALGSLAIGLLLAAVATLLAREMRSLLIGESASREEVEEINRVLAGHDKIVRSVSLRTLYLGPDDLMIEVKAEFDHDLTFMDVAEAIDEIESDLRERLPAARLVVIEPDLPQLSDGADPEIPDWMGGKDDER